LKSHNLEHTITHKYPPSIGNKRNNYFERSIHSFRPVFSTHIFFTLYLHYILLNNLLEWPLLYVSTQLHPFPRLLQVSFSPSIKIYVLQVSSCSQFTFVLLLTIYILHLLPQGCSWKCERLLRPSRALHRDDSKEAEASQALINDPV